MPANPDSAAGLVATWRLNDRVTRFLIESLPEKLWPQKIPGAPRRTIRMMAGHLHNCRCMWIKTLGRRHGLEPPPGVNRHTVTREELLPALEESREGIAAIIRLGTERGGRLAGFPLDMTHFLAYHVAHEGHHRGQIVMVARQLGHRLPPQVTGGLWQWSKRAKELEG